jgi:hypothetical protein
MISICHSVQGEPICDNESGKIMKLLNCSLRSNEGTLPSKTPGASSIPSTRGLDSVRSLGYFFAPFAFPVNSQASFNRVLT